MLNLVPSSLLLRPTSTPRPPAKNPNRGCSAPKPAPEALDGCSDGTARGEAHQERPGAEGPVTSHHRDACAAEEEKPQPLLDLSPLRDPLFAIFTWSFMFSHLAYFVPTFHLAARARTLGIGSMDASYLIAAAGTAKRLFNPFVPNGQEKQHKSCQEIVPNVS